MHAGKEILQHCVDVGGSITGEHGVGMEKNDYMPMLFTGDDMEVMRRLRDVFNPRSILNPQKVLPATRSCREVKAADFPGVVA